MRAFAPEPFLLCVYVCTNVRVLMLFSCIHSSFFDAIDHKAKQMINIRVEPTLTNEHVGDSFVISLSVSIGFIHLNKDAISCRLQFVESQLCSWYYCVCVCVVSIYEKLRKV